MLLGGPNWPNYLIFFLSFFRWRNDWHLWYHFCSLYILSWISLPKGDPVLSCLLGKKERRKSLSQYEMLSRLFPIGGLRDLHSSMCKSSFYRKIKSFLVLELSSYILSVLSFSSLCWPYFSLEFSPFFGHCLLSTTDKTKVFLWIPSLATIFSTLFRDFFFAEK